MELIRPVHKTAKRKAKFNPHFLEKYLHFLQWEGKGGESHLNCLICECSLQGNGIGQGRGGYRRKVEMAEKQEWE